MLHPVSLRNQKAILSLPQLYRICTELPEHTVLSYFPLFIFDVICRKSEVLRLVRTSAITAFGEYTIVLVSAAGVCLVCTTTVIPTWTLCSRGSCDGWLIEADLVGLRPAKIADIKRGAEVFR